MVKSGDPTRVPHSHAGATPNAGRKPLQVRPRLPVSKKRKPSLVRSFFQYLSSDSFMYGPLLTPSSPPPPSPPELPVSQKPDEGFDIPRPTSPAGEHQGFSTFSSLHTPPSPISRLRSMSAITKRILGRVTPETARNRTNIAPAPFEIRHNYGQEGLQIPSLEHNEKPSDKSEVIINGPLAGVIDDEEEDNDSYEENEFSKSFSESQSEHAVTPLSNEFASEVARRIVRKVGGRFSKELGIFVDGRDSEVERWFLATTFFNQPSDFEQSKQMFKKLQSMGIYRIEDVLKVNQIELEEAFENTMRNHRIATRLRKIALDLQTLHGDGVCRFKRVMEYSELKRNLESLSGYSRHSANTFLREMRGVWPGANPDFEARTRNAAKHLRLLSSSNDGAGVTSALVELGQDAGLDARDLEVALLKVSFQHARHYRNCPGGHECEYASEYEFARMTLSDVDHLIANL